MKKTLNGWKFLFLFAIVFSKVQVEVERTKCVLSIAKLLIAV